MASQKFIQHQHKDEDYNARKREKSKSQWRKKQRAWKLSNRY